MKWSTSHVATNRNTKSSWAGTVVRLVPLTEGHNTVVDVDFVRDVEWIAEHFCSNGVKAGKYTGPMESEDKNETERRFLQGEFSVLVATEAFELGVSNQNYTIRVGSPRNLGILLQEFGRAGRKPGSSTNAFLFLMRALMINTWVFGSRPH